MEHMGDRDMEHVDYDAELRLHNDALRRAYEIGPEDRVLDIGCGAGQTTRDAARLASEGWALGVDISKEMIERADLLAEAEGLRNITFEHADAQDHRFPSERFDLAISRFGTMFFRDPIAAFTNIGRGLRRAGRLLMMVWQGHERNEWSVSIERALAATVGSPVPASEGLGPFSLADPATVRRVLDAAGFTDVTFTGVRQPSTTVRTLPRSRVGRWFRLRQGGVGSPRSHRQRARARTLARDARRARSGGRRLVRLARLDREGAPPVTPTGG